MKNLKLKSNVKNTLYIILGIIFIALCIKTLNNDYNDAVNECVKSGNSYNYCTNGLK